MPVVVCAMTVVTQHDSVSWLGSEIWMPGVGVDMMDVQAICSSTSLAGLITFKNSLSPPVVRSVKRSMLTLVVCQIGVVRRMVRAFAFRRTNGD